MQKSTSDSLVKDFIKLQNGETRKDSITALDNLRDNHNFIFGYLGSLIPLFKTRWVSSWYINYISIC